MPYGRLELLEESTMTSFKLVWYATTNSFYQ